MLNYILRRLAQAVPQLFLISIVLFMLMQAFGDPIASLGVRTPPRPADRERLRRQLGLDQPLYIQYLSWLIGNDWMKIDQTRDGWKRARLVDYQHACELVIITCTGQQLLMSRGSDEFDPSKEKRISLKWKSQRLP